MTKLKVQMNAKKTIFEMNSTFVFMVI